MVAWTLRYRLDEEAQELEVASEVTWPWATEADQCSRTVSKTGSKGYEARPIPYMHIAGRYLGPRTSGARQAGEILHRKDPPLSLTSTGESWGVGVAALPRRMPNNAAVQRELSPSIPDLRVGAIFAAVTGLTYADTVAVSLPRQVG
jgi:hypothetical protein